MVGVKEPMMKRKLLRYVLWITFVAGLIACGGSTEPQAAAFDLESLIVNVFDPQPGEKILVMVDVPQGVAGDNASAWYMRREMASRWHTTIEALSSSYGFEVLPLLKYPATGAHSGPLPVEGEMDDQTVRIDEVLAETNIALALTEYSATAPLIEATQRYPNLRVASMPTISASMEGTALAADYGEVGRKVRILTEKLDRSSGAAVRFSTGHEMYFDLRYRHAEADDGQLHADETGARVINLPSGEAYIVPYEGEKEGIPSNTEGMIPFLCESDMALLEVKGNRVVEVLGEGGCATGIRDFLTVDDARRNIAEMGLGVNDRAVVTGNALEDEKVKGMHWAFGLSEALGGTVGVDDFSDPSHALHWDIVYPTGGEIEIASVVLEYEDGSSEEIMREGQYTAFTDGTQELSLVSIVDTLSSAWFFLASACVAIVAWDMEKLKGLTWGTKFAWAWIGFVLGPLGLLAYFQAHRRKDAEASSEASTLFINDALSATVYAAAGAITGFVMIFVLAVLFPTVDTANPVVTLGLMLGLPYVVGLFAFRFPFMVSQTSGRYSAALRMSLFPELISTLFVLAGMFPAVLFPLVIQSDTFGGANLPTFALFSFGGIVGAIVAYAYNRWLVRREYSVWSGRTEVLEGETAGERAVKVPTFRDAWSALLVGVILMAISLGVTLASLI